MEKGYRIPTIDEFVPGFKYELSLEILNDMLEVPYEENWTSAVVKEDEEIWYIEHLLEFNLVRVKI